MSEVEMVKLNLYVRGKVIKCMPVYTISALDLDRAF